MDIRKHLPINFPKIVCLCGSTRFMEAFKDANLNETIAGNVVLSIGCDTKSDKDLIALGKLTKEAKEGLDELHKRKIDLADEILVLNVDGYIGESTRSEIEYAKKTNKSIRMLEYPKQQTPYFVVFADNVNQYNRFVKENKVKNPVFVDKAGDGVNVFGLDLNGFIILGKPAISQQLFNVVNRRIRSSYVVVDKNESEHE